MFELSIAFKYLTPRWRQLSVSIISLISILVIALVVWLIVVFFSVTYGLERNWIDRLIALTAPVRIVPTEEYYDSYYSRVDTLSASSGYSLKSIGEKRLALHTDPYDPGFDVEIPATWPKPDLDADGKLKDPVKEAFNAMQVIPGVTSSDYEMTMANFKLKLLRKGSQSALSQAAYLGSYDPDNKMLQGAILPISIEDVNHTLAMTQFGAEDMAPPEVVQERLKALFSDVTVHALEAPTSWILPKALYPDKASWKATFKGDRAEIDPMGKDPLIFEKGKPNFNGPLILVGGVQMEATLDPESLEKATRPQALRFNVRFQVQGTEIRGQVPYGNLSISRADLPSVSLTKDPELGSAILLPRGFKDAGVLAGDRGSLVYLTPTASQLQEQNLPIFVGGFYDPGIIPVGGKFLIVPKEISSLIRSSYNQDDMVQGNGINVRFSDLARADSVKEQLERSFQEAGIAPYWKVETFREYDFTKDVIQQLKSEKTLFTLLATIIIVVACSNIVSMLIILVNDKKLEIGILRSMGATSGSIALIFGTCGIIMGAVGSGIGILAALFTLRHLQVLVNLISRIQGHDLFNPIYYGEQLPNTLSWDSLLFVIVTTTTLSLISGLVPAIKASMMRPSAILRAE